MLKFFLVYFFHCFPKVFQTAIGRYFRVAFCLCVKTTRCETIHMKMYSANRFIVMQIKLIFTWKVLHEDSF